MTSTRSTMKEENICEDGNESIRSRYNCLCLDLNMDIETCRDAWNSYEHVLKHYVLEGDDIHWLAVSLYISCRRNKYLCQSTNNPISISRLLKSANQLNLIEFFDKLHKWEDMENLPDHIRFKIDQVENAFQISSIIFEKYSQIFLFVFGGNLNKLISYDYTSQRTLNDFNPKFNQKNKQKKCSIYHFYSLIWTIYALAKTIYPSTINDLIASFHLLIASFEFIYQYAKIYKLDYLLKGECLNELNEETIIDKLCLKYSCSAAMTRTIYEEHLKNELFQFIISKDFSNENNCLMTMNLINKKYDEIVLTNCIIDERIFLENINQFNDFVNSLNENRNSKSDQNKTPLTANQHLTFANFNQSNQTLTPISQANQLINLLYSIVQQQNTTPNTNLTEIIGEQHFLDDLVERVKEWENVFYCSYDSIDLFDKCEENIAEMKPSDSCKSRFDLALKLFYNALENILIIEKKRLVSIDLPNQQIHQSFHKLILNNEFLKSLLGLCLLLVLFAHSDMSHDLNWILNLYSLHGYSFLKIIQIYLKTSKQLNKSRSFIKYLSSCEETILSSMAFQTDSALWNDIQTKGILTYQQIQSLQIKTNHPITTPTNLSSMYFQSPNSNNVKRKLFSNLTTDQINNNPLTIIRSRSDPLVETNVKNVVKTSPYTMFYRKLYDLVISRVDLISIRLFGSEGNQFEKIVWNLFLFLFENSTKFLFCSRHLDQIILSCIYYVAHSNQFEKDQLTWTRLIQAYKAMPNAKLKTLRSVFIRQINPNENNNEQNQLVEEKNPCLTPSKPAGTIRLIDGNFIGDITSFYEEIFLKNESLKLFFETNVFVDLPERRKTIENQNEHISYHIGKNLFVDYSSNPMKSNIFSPTNQQSQSTSNHSNNNSSSNILSSSIQAGANNTVRTTRTRTEDGKFLTTISTISKFSHCDEKHENVIINRNETNLLFGQSTNQSIKRTLSDDSNSNCLTSLTKKVLQIENDRQKHQLN